MKQLENLITKKNKNQQYPTLKDLTDNFLEDILKNINILSGFQNEFVCCVSAIVRTKQHGTIANRS